METSLYRDFSKYIATEKDRRTFRNWVRGLAIFYSLAGLLLVVFVTAQSNHPETPGNVAATATPAASTVVSIKKVEVR